MNRYKVYEQVRITDAGNKWYSYIGTVSGYLCDGVAYVDLGDSGPKNRNGKPVIQVYPEWKLIATNIYPYVYDQKELPAIGSSDRQYLQQLILSERSWAKAKVDDLIRRFHRQPADPELRAYTQRLEAINKLLGNY
jgi:hypothetical protein